MKYFFPIHLDGDNRGCEGIAKGTAILLSEPKENLVGLCSNIKLDERLCINNYINLMPSRAVSLLYRIVDKVYNCWAKITNKDSYETQLFTFWYFYRTMLKKITAKDILISTGGDMMCYDDNQVIYTNEIAKRKGAKTVLWACSMGKENQSDRKLDTLRKFDIVYAREQLTYQYFKSLGLKNIIQYPDPAFVLTPEKVDLPPCFKSKKVIGLNLSKFTVGSDDLNTPFGLQVRQVIDYIIKETDYHILLIPHVMWRGQDDRIISNDLYRVYCGNTERISVLDSNSYNYLQIRYIISKCDLFIGGRTHAVISAYSTCVPTIALGYSIKSEGIALDLKLPSQLVVKTKGSDENELLRSFIYLRNNKENIKEHLENTVPEYISRLANLKEDFIKIAIKN